MPILLPLLFAASAPTTYSSADLADAQCVATLALVASGLSKETSPDPKAVAGIVSGMTYFIGKMRGRTPSLDLEAILRSVFPAVKQNPKVFTDRCGAEMTAVGQSMDAIGKSLAADGI